MVSERATRSLCMNILDIDVDVFLSSVTSLSGERDGNRVAESAAQAWHPGEVRVYLESAIGIPHGTRIPGKTFSSHEELLPELVSLGRPVHLFHLDAHADLGLASVGGTLEDFECRFLAIDPSDRASRLSDFRPRDLDFLLYAIACGCVERFTYISHEDQFKVAPDFPRTMESWERKYTHGTLTLKRFDGPAKRYHMSREESFIDDVSVPIRAFKRRDPSLPGILNAVEFDRIYVTQSPSYTPKSADPIFEMLRDEYILAPN